MPGYVVDGNDVLAVYAATREAVRRARAGEGPTLLECKTWRRHQHALRDVVTPGPPAGRADRRTGPRATRWRGSSGTWWSKGIMNADQLADVGQTIDRDLEDAVAFAEASPYPAPEEALEDVFAR